MFPLTLSACSQASHYRSVGNSPALQTRTNYFIPTKKKHFNIAWTINSPRPKPFSPTFDALLWQKPTLPAIPVSFYYTLPHSASASTLTLEQRKPIQHKTKKAMHDEKCDLIEQLFTEREKIEIKPGLDGGFARWRSVPCPERVQVSRRRKRPSRLA